MKTKEELKKEIINAKKELEQLENKELSLKTKFKIGDIVEYINEGDSYTNERDTWECGKISKIEMVGGYIYATIGFDIKNVDKLKIFNEDDYELRHYVIYEDLEVGDEFKLIREKQNSTLNNKYICHKKIEQINCETEYWYLNDSNEFTRIYEGDFHIIP